MKNLRDFLFLRNYLCDLSGLLTPKEPLNLFFAFFFSITFSFHLSLLFLTIISKKVKRKSRKILGSWQEDLLCKNLSHSVIAVDVREPKIPAFLTLLVITIVIKKINWESIEEREQEEDLYHQLGLIYLYSFVAKSRKKNIWHHEEASSQPRKALNTVISLFGESKSKTRIILLYQENHEENTTKRVNITFWAQITMKTPIAFARSSPALQVSSTSSSLPSLITCFSTTSGDAIKGRKLQRRLRRAQFTRLLQVMQVVSTP